MPPQRAGAAGAAQVVLENGGAATWRSRGADGLQLSYHWLDRHRNAIVWDGPRTPFPRPVAPGETVALDVRLVAPRPAGRYVLRFDLVEEHRFWLSELGVEMLELEVDVEPGIAERRLSVVVHGGPDERTTAALAAQEEPLVAEAPVATAHLVAGAEPAAGLVAPAARRACGRLGRGRARARACRRRARAAPRRPLACAVGAGRPQSAARRAASAPVPRRGPRAREARRASRVRGRGTLRGPGRRQASDAIRSSTALKTSAPTTSATTAATHR